MSDVSVTINLPTKDLALLFQEWFRRAGFDDFGDQACSKLGVYTSVSYDSAKWFCRVLVTGLVVDDDDPEVHGDFGSNE